LRAQFQAALDKRRDGGAAHVPRRYVLGETQRRVAVNMLVAGTVTVEQLKATKR
jgi:hypothetical protein